MSRSAEAWLASHWLEFDTATGFPAQNVLDLT
jgi:hypothetical protein